MSRQRRLTPPALRQLVAGVALLVAPIATLGAAPSGTRAPTVRAGEPSLQFVVTAADGVDQVIALADRIDRDLMAFRFRLDVVDAGGASAKLERSFTLTLRVVSQRHSSELRLSGVSRELTIPRPWALRLGVGDSLHITVELDGGTSPDVALRLSVESEPIERSRSRLPVLSARAEARENDPLGGATQWEWVPAESGRLIAIAGLPLEQLGAISLIDVTSGSVIWSADLGGSTSAVPSSAGGALRFGVPVVAGRTYRLIARCECDLAPTASARVVAMVLPSR